MRSAAGSSESGFTIVELLIAASLTMVIMGTALAGFQAMSETSDGVALIADVNVGLRTAVNLMTRDLLSAGRDIPVGGIPVPSGPNAQPLVRPSPADLDITFPPGETALAAVTAGQGLGPAINGVATDMLTLLMADTDLQLNTAFLTDVAGDGSSADVDAAIAIDDPAIGIRAGDLIMLANSLDNALVMVTGRDGQRLEFDGGDDMNLNQADAGQGTLVQLQSAPGEYPPTTATRVLMVSYYVDATTPGRPALIRRLNFGPERAIAVGIENVQITYDLVDGVTNPANLPEPVLPNTADQMRKANLFLSGRSFREWRRTGQILRSSVSTQVSLRSLSFRDRY